MLGKLFWSFSNYRIPAVPAVAERKEFILVIRRVLSFADRGDKILSPDEQGRIDTSNSPWEHKVSPLIVAQKKKLKDLSRAWAAKK